MSDMPVTSPWIRATPKHLMVTGGFALTDTSLKAPLIDGQNESQLECGQKCILQLERGQLTFLGRAPPATFAPPSWNSRPVRTTSP